MLLTHVLFLRSQSLTVLSSLQEAINLPSGEYLERKGIESKINKNPTP